MSNTGVSRLPDAVRSYGSGVREFFLGHNQLSRADGNLKILLRYIYVHLLRICIYTAIPFRNYTGNAASRRFIVPRAASVCSRELWPQTRSISRGIFDASASAHYDCRLNFSRAAAAALGLLVGAAVLY